MQQKHQLNSITPMVDGRYHVLITRLLFHISFQYYICVCLINTNDLGFDVLQFHSKVYLLYMCIAVILISLSISQYILMCSMCVCDMVPDICISIL